ncbi:MAG: hypothetical protein JXQ83_02220 [Candidatus Glassbacteria bacterium]|nr:hypothetical protein [Candidatus Glassbacteria bacterium]
MEFIRIGETRVSRFILGSNPFSGFSHQGPEMDLRMMRYYTTRRIKETLREAERLGIDTLIGRTDHHVMRFLLEYRDEGGRLQWFAQTCPFVGPQEMCVERAVEGGAAACHIHGGVMDHLFAQGKAEEAVPVVKMIREAGMLAGVAAHNPEVIRWAEKNLEVDYYMCSYYNSEPRDEKEGHDSQSEEWFRDEDRRVMAQLIQGLSKPAVHYKIMAAGRNDPAEAFSFAAGCMRPVDAVCVGIYSENIPGMFEQDVNLFLDNLKNYGKFDK